MEGVCGNATANRDLERAAKIIESSGMPLKKARTKTAKEFSVKRGTVRGSVVLNTKAINRGIYMYQMTQTPEIEASWETVYYGRTVLYKLYNLSEGRYFFRTGFGGENQTGHFSDALSLFVV